MKQKAVVFVGENSGQNNNWLDKDKREFSPAQRIEDDWTLITAGNVSTDTTNWNTMTASWGGFGELWAKPVAFIFVRPTRRTFSFVNENALFTLSFFDKTYRSALQKAGAKSGRDIDKASECGVTPIAFSNEAIGFKEAEEIIICKKLYEYDFDPRKFLDSAIETHYPDQDYHRMYIGEITSVKVKRA
jgi:flavin reductase (DIM6/NTAB) family NADH-FMN oxidoreductase RutF